MVKNKQIQERIIKLLRRYPEGLPILEIARFVGVHRHTVTKYIYELIGANIIRIREIGTAKVCILKEKFAERVSGEKVLKKLKKRMKRSKSLASIKSQSELLPIIFLVGLLSTSVIAYQNITGFFVANESNLTNEFSEIQIENTSTTEIPIDEKPILDISVEYSERITRGEVIELKATVTNTGLVEAKNVVLTWRLPQGFEIVSGEKEKNCGVLEFNSSCISEITVQTSVSTELGINEVKVVVNYET